MKRILMYILVAIVVCTGIRADALTRLYYPDGSTRLVGKSLVMAETAMGASVNPHETYITIYSPAGNAKMIKRSDRAQYPEDAWFDEPVCNMYAADGRTRVTKTAEVEAYLNVGWYLEPVCTMYAADGRTRVTKKTEVEAYLNVGWYLEPVCIMYAADGRTRVTKKTEIEAYKNVGWYERPEDIPRPNGKMIALTFDDGPSKYTDRILDCLEQYGAKATFFVVGNSVNAYPNTLKRAHQLGMEIGNHTMTHPNLKTLGADSIKSQLERTNSAIISAGGTTPRLLRPPYGNYNSTVQKVAGMPLILWSIDTLDWKTRNADKTVSCVLNEVKDGSVILMHDLYSQSADAAVRLIPLLIDRGYQLVTVSELAKAKGYQLEKGTVYSRFKAK